MSHDDSALNESNTTTTASSSISTADNNNENQDIETSLQGRETPLTQYNLPPMVSPSSVESATSIETIRPANTTATATGTTLHLSVFPNSLFLVPFSF